MPPPLMAKVSMSLTEVMVKPSITARLPSATVITGLFPLPAIIVSAAPPALFKVRDSLSIIMFPGGNLYTPGATMMVSPGLEPWIAS